MENFLRVQVINYLDMTDARNVFSTFVLYFHTIRFFDIDAGYSCTLELLVTNCTTNKCARIKSSPPIWKMTNE